MNVLRARLLSVGLACLAMSVGACSSDDAGTASDASADSSLPPGDGAPGADTSAPPVDGAADSGPADTGVLLPDASQGTDATDGQDASQDVGRDANPADAEVSDGGSPGDGSAGDGAIDASPADAGDGGFGDAAVGDAGDAGGSGDDRCTTVHSSPHDGGVDQAPCTTDDDCDSFYWCERPLAACTGTGTCTRRNPIPDQGFMFAPVCGCNGKTYLSSTEAIAASQNFTGGACSSARPCNSNADCCPSDDVHESFCMKPVGQCAGQGICVVPSLASCVAYDDPVCPCGSPPQSTSINDLCVLYHGEVNARGYPVSAADGGETCDY